MADQPIQRFMVFDVESVGLHGEGFSVGWVLVDRAGIQTDATCLFCDPAKAKGNEDDRKWVTENVPTPGLAYQFESLRELREQFWHCWMVRKRAGAVLVADCPWPVEANFLSACIADDPSRKWDGPYPLIDVASVRLAAGFDPLATCGRLPSELPVHDPLRDAMQSARLFVEALRAWESRG